MTTLRPSPQPCPLGKSGISVFPIAWGMWRLAGNDVGDARHKVEAALDAGITLFDTADIYGCDTPAGFGSAEALFGRVLADAPALRDRMVIATKGGIMPGIPYDSSTTYLASAIDSSLSRMGIDQIDLYQIHRRDFLTHPQEVAASLTAMVDSGKVRALGVSNYSTDELAALQSFLSLPLVSTQPEFSALRTAPLFDGTLDQAMARDMAVLAWSPLGGGRLVAGEHPAATLIAEQGARFSVDASAASLSWIMAHPARPIPIVGSQSPERIARSVDAFKVEWTRSEWYAVLEASLGERLP
ncbi:aldo/keto reductase [Sphingobium sp. H39-3-25]|uniref:aldo/keto reductase n=1 Tax=Sphingobium arseniciresistens TaxID=3030834 RepID=UPI0023BA24E3|nr:aldo/keto reductase [Sphingobium arseniciresistens]